MNKKVIKTVSIVILVLVTMAVTIFVFYQQLTKRKDSFAHVNAYMVSDSRAEFDTELASAAGYTDRADLFIQTNEQLTDMTRILNTYLINAKDYKIDENDIISKLDRAVKSRNNAESDLEEYLFKCRENDKLGLPFNKTLAFNNSYDALSKFIVHKALFVQTLNSEISNAIKVDTDIKFPMIDMYTRVVDKVFNSRVENSEISKVDHEEEINNLNLKIEFEAGYLVPSVEEEKFSSDYNAFINSYKKCDKNSFVNNFSTLISNTSGVNNDSSNEQVAAWYLKKILGM